ncbi:MAG TPA: J domain-containing protein [Thermomicrobiales bacterium]|nr:J domain-containing protein [Thermomicrobiales bacterium]
MEDYYATLRVRPGASRAEIERSYRRLARIYHPDLLRDATPEARQRAETMLKRINVAYGVIGDPRRRREYDRERAARLARATLHRRQAARSRPARTTEHWQGGGPVRVEWDRPPPVAPRRPPAGPATAKLLLWGAALIVAFAILLALLWRPGRAPGPTPTTLPAVTRPAGAAAHGAAALILRGARPAGFARSGRLPARL